jgi:hypothetical protein
LYPVCDGPVHPYIGASAGCWAVYGRILEREYGEFRYPDVHRLTVDAFAAQHPGVPSRQSIQSVAVHLIGLHLVLERGAGAKEATAAIRAAVRRGGFEWLDPPTTLGAAASVSDVLGATDLADHERRVLLWAQSVWAAWQTHAVTVRSWAVGE